MKSKSRSITTEDALRMMRKLATGGTIDGDVTVTGGLNVGGNATFGNREQTLLDLLGYQPSMVKMGLNDDYTEYPTSYNYFHPFFGGVTILGQQGNLTVETRNTDYGDRTGVRVRGIRIGANISAVQVMASVRYLSNSATVTGVHTLLYLAPADGSTPYTIGSSVGAYNDIRFSQHINTIVTGLKEGDRLFIATYKAYAARDIDVIASGRATQMSVVAIG